MPRSILVPLDGSALAEQALAPAVELAVAREAELRLATVHIVPPAGLVAAMSSELIADADRESRAAEERYLEAKAAELAAAHGLAARWALLDGEPATAIAEHADEVDLIVMTTHGRGGLSRLWLGSVADRLVRRTDRPVLLIHARQVPPAGGTLFDRVLVPLDGSRRAEAALAILEGWLPPDRGTLHLLQVVEPTFIFAPPPRTVPDQPEAESLQHRTLVAYRYLRRLAAGARASDRDVAVHVPVGTDVAGQILSVVREHDVTLVALATRGRGGPARWVLGGTADKLVRAAERPVLVCQAPDGGDEPSEHYRYALEHPDPAEERSPPG